MKTICLLFSLSLLFFSNSYSNESEYDKAVSLVKKAIKFYDKNIEVAYFKQERFFWKVAGEFYFYSDETGE